jgi:hypothetical protein
MSRYLILCLLAISFSLHGFSKKYGLPSSNQLKIIDVTIFPDGRALVGKDTFQVDGLAKEIQTRLWKSYLGTGKMYSAIRIHFNGEVLMGVRSAALDAIKEGQDKALTDLCIQKHEKNYDQLSRAEQQKLKRKFPVLFQELHW